MSELKAPQLEYAEQKSSDPKDVLVDEVFFEYWGGVPSVRKRVLCEDEINRLAYAQEKGLEPKDVLVDAVFSHKKIKMVLDEKDIDRLAYAQEKGLKPEDVLVDAVDEVFDFDYLRRVPRKRKMVLDKKDIDRLAYAQEKGLSLSWKIHHENLYEKMVASFCKDSRQRIIKVKWYNTSVASNDFIARLILKTEAEYKITVKYAKGYVSFYDNRKKIPPDIHLLLDYYYYLLCLKCDSDLRSRAWGCCAIEMPYVDGISFHDYAIDLKKSP